MGTIRPKYLLYGYMEPLGAMDMAFGYQDSGLCPMPRVNRMQSCECAIT